MYKASPALEASSLGEPSARIRITWGVRGVLERQAPGRGLVLVRVFEQPRDTALPLPWPDSLGERMWIRKPQRQEKVSVTRP